MTADRSLEATISLLAEAELARERADAAGDRAGSALAAALQLRLRQRLQVERLARQS